MGREELVERRWVENGTLGGVGVDVLIKVSNIMVHVRSGHGIFDNLLASKASTGKRQLSTAAHVQERGLGSEEAPMGVNESDDRQDDCDDDEEDVGEG